MLLVSGQHFLSAAALSRQHLLIPLQAWLDPLGKEWEIIQLIAISKDSIIWEHLESVGSKDSFCFHLQLQHMNANADNTFNFQKALY